MKKSDVKISVKIGEISDCPLLGSWDYICDKYGLNKWCLNEGLATKDDTIQISIEDAEYIGILDD